MGKVLVIHGLRKTSRSNSIELTKSFLNYSYGTEFHYVNVLGFAASLRAQDVYDLALVTSDALALRSFAAWPDLEDRLVRLLGQAKRRVLLTQDEYTFSSRIDELAIRAKVDSIWTVVPENLDKLFPKSFIDGVRFERCLTGYVDDEVVAKSRQFSKSYSARTTDLGQRVSELSLIFGVLGKRKSEIAIVLAAEFKSRGFRVDVSTDSTDVLLGDEWLGFLGDTRFTVSRKGGSSIADRSGFMFESLERVQVLAPSLPEAVKKKFTSKRDVLFGSWAAESPRLFEAASMGVCQILEEDIYLNGDMKPWVHYVPLASDFSNLDEIFEFISRDERVIRVVDAARKLLVESGKYSYRSFVQAFLFKELANYTDMDTNPSSMIDKDLQSQLDVGAVQRAVKMHFRNTNLLKLFGEFFGTRPAEAARLYRELTALEVVPEIFTESWSALSDISI